MDDVTKYNRIAFVVMLLLVIYPTFFILPLINDSRITFDADEATKAVLGLSIYQSLMDYNLNDFIAYTYSTQDNLYPFLHGWYLGLFYYLTGVSLATSRLASLLMLGFSAIILYWIGVLMDGKRGWMIGLISVFMLFLSRKTLLLSGLCMIEITGLFTSLCTIYVFFKALDTGGRHYYLLTGFFTTLTFLTKYNYGIFLLVPIIIVEIADLYSHINSKSKLYDIGLNNLMIFLSILPSIFWTILSWNSFIKFLTTQPVRTTLFSLENIKFYPQVIYTDYSVSLAVYLLLTLSLILSLRQLKNQKILFLSSFFLFTLFLMFLKLQNEVRFIITCIPALYLITGLQITDMMGKKQLSVRHSSILFTLLLLVSIPGMIQLYSEFPGLLKKEYEGVSFHHDILDHITSVIKENKTIGLYCAWDQMPTTSIQWFLAKEKDWKVKDIEVIRGCRMVEEQPYYHIMFSKKNHVSEDRSIPESYTIIDKKIFKHITVIIAVKNRKASLSETV